MATPSRHLSILNCWSKAGIGTSIVLSCDGEGKNNAGSRIALDMGTTPAFGDCMSASVVLLTHGHVDHVGAIFSHARVRKLRSSIPTYFLPASIVPLVQAAKEAMMALDGTGKCREKDLLEMKLIGVNPGDEFNLPLRKQFDGSQLFIRVFATSHAGCPSVGYVIGRRLKPSLKREYQGLPGEKLRELAKSGIQLKETTEYLEVAYSGDTTVDALSETKSIWESCHTIICECTMLQASDIARDMAHDRGHMHIDDIVQLFHDVDLRKDQRLVLMHISDRYNAEEALELIAESIPQEISRNILVSVSGLTRSYVFKSLSQHGLLSLSTYLSKNRKAEDN
jgi:ribonuclease BN (tRNA processing enzyme)